METVAIVKMQSWVVKESYPSFGVVIPMIVREEKGGLC